jgi:Fe-S cluster assembly iron-binding protein IscA
LFKGKDDGKMKAITIDGITLGAIKEWLAGNAIQKPIRLELCFKGCCDPALGLKLDSVKESDIVQEIGGVTFIIEPETQELVGDINIFYSGKSGKNSFLITSSRQVSEWEGFCESQIKV